MESVTELIVIDLKMAMPGQAWWYTSVISATQEAEVGGS
jgi:hypothetical protein